MGVCKKKGGGEKPQECARDPSSSCAFTLCARSLRQVWKCEEEEAGQRCWGCGNDGAERADGTSLILYERRIAGENSAPNAMEHVEGESLPPLSNLCGGFACGCGFIWSVAPT